MEGPVLYPMPVVNQRYIDFWHVKLLSSRECDHILEDESIQTMKRYDRKDEGGEAHHGFAELWPGKWDWLYERVTKNVMAYNRSQRFALSGFTQPIVVNKYEKGDWFDLHHDHTPNDLSKIAFSVPLNDAYEGGGMLLVNHGEITVAKGEMLLFPAYLGHGVKEITDGVRYCLVGWVAGPRFV